MIIHGMKLVVIMEVFLDPKLRSWMLLKFRMEVYMKIFMDQVTRQEQL